MKLFLNACLIRLKFDFNSLSSKKNDILNTYLINLLETIAL